MLGNGREFIPDEKEGCLSSSLEIYVESFILFLYELVLLKEEIFRHFSITFMFSNGVIVRLRGVQVSAAFEVFFLHEDD